MFGESASNFKKDIIRREFLSTLTTEISETNGNAQKWLKGRIYEVLGLDW